MQNPPSSVSEAQALRRLSLVQQIIDLVHQHWPLSAALEQVAAAHPLPAEADAPPTFVAKRTLEDWYYAFKKGGFDALKPKPRCDRGKPRRFVWDRVCERFELDEIAAAVRDCLKARSKRTVAPPPS